MNKIIRYVRWFTRDAERKNPGVDKRILKSALVYQFLYHKHFNKYVEVRDILLEHEDIGLIGYGDGCLTHLLEHTLGWINVLQTHAILHDAFGRFYVKHSLDRGYSYAFPRFMTTKFNKLSPLSGQLSGLWYCVLNRIVI